MRRRDFLRMAGAGLAVGASAVVLAPTRRFWPGACLVSPQTVTIQKGTPIVIINGVEYRIAPAERNFMDELAAVYGLERMDFETDKRLEARVARMIHGGARHRIKAWKI